MKDWKNNTNDKQVEAAVQPYGNWCEKGMDADLNKKEYHYPKVFFVHKNNKQSDVEGDAEHIKKGHEVTAHNLKIEYIKQVGQHHANKHQIEYP